MAYQYIHLVGSYTKSVTYKHLKEALIFFTSHVSSMIVL